MGVVFYDSIYKIANASNLSARLVSPVYLSPVCCTDNVCVQGDLQAFFDDLIKVAMSDNRGESHPSLTSNEY